VSLVDLGLPPVDAPNGPTGPPVAGDPVPPPDEPDPGDTAIVPPPIGGASESPSDTPGVEPPIALIGCTDSTPTAGDQLDCSWMVPPAGPDDPPGTTYGGAPDTWEWSLTGPENASSNGQFFTHTVSTPGTYELTLTVANAADSDVETRTIEVAPAPQPQPPQVTAMNCSTNSPPRVGDTVTCDATTSGDVDEMVWSWVPPTSGAYSGPQQSLTDTFVEPGSHRVEVTVTGAGGQQHSDSRTFDVQAEPLAINAVSCNGPGKDGEDLYRANTSITCTADVTSQVDNYAWSMSTGPSQTDATFDAILPRVPADRAQRHWIEVSVDGPGGDDTQRYNFTVYECAPPGVPSSC
jgi:hypothetical protein